MNEVQTGKVKKVKAKQRAQKSLTFEERIAVIFEYPHVRSARILSEKYKCGKTQIVNIVRNKQEYLDKLAAQEKEKLGKAQTMSGNTIQPGLYSAIGVILYEWILRAKAYMPLITEEQIVRRAKNIADFLGITDFKISNNWLLSFRRRYNVDKSTLTTNPSKSAKMHKKSLKIINIAINSRYKLPKPVVTLLEERINILKNLNFNNIKPAVSHVNFTNNFIQNQIHIGYQQQQVNGIKIKTGLNNSVSPPQFSIEDQEMIEASPSNLDSDDGADIAIENTNNNSDSIESSKESSKEKVNNYSEALEKLKLIEEFVLLQEDFRSVGLLNHLEIHIKKKLEKQ